MNKLFLLFGQTRWLDMREMRGKEEGQSLNKQWICKGQPVNTGQVGSDATPGEPLRPLVGDLDRA